VSVFHSLRGRAISLRRFFAAIWPAAHRGGWAANLPRTCILMVETAPARRNFAP